MARNTVQNKKCNSASQNSIIATESKSNVARCCRGALAAGLPVPGCGSEQHSVVTTRDLFQCSGCRLQTSPIAGTIFA